MKKFWFWIFLVLAVVAILAFANYVPFWVSLTTAAAFIAGGVAGWILHNVYVKYIQGNSASPEGKGDNESR